MSKPVVMGSRIVAVALCATAAWLGLSASGCYNPKVKNGGFTCPNGYLQDCPEGFTCSGGVCVRPELDAGGELPVDMGAGRRDAADARDTPAEVMIDAGLEKPPVCFTPVANCTAVAGKKCDPVCQTGCGCEEKCSVNTVGTLTCNRLPSTARRHLGESCDIVSEGQSAQTDQCDPGLACMNQNCGSRCVRFCRSDQDCPGSTCSDDRPGGVKVCDVPFVQCNPVKNLGPTGCPLTAQACYVSTSVVPEQTLCDCSSLSAFEGMACRVPRDCIVGLTCVDATSTGDLRCRRVCSRTAGTGPNGCTTGTTCTALQGSDKYGFCN